jgi:hypothetical protein
MNKWGVNSGVSGVTETDAGHDMLLRLPISKMAAKFQNGHQKKEISYMLLWKLEMNKWGVNSGVSRVIEIDAGQGILLRSPISKVAANATIRYYDRSLNIG